MQFIKKLLRILFVWNVPAASEKQLQTADAIVTQSCGRKKDGSGSRGDLLMAGIARHLQEKYHLPLLVQDDLKIADPEIPAICVAEDLSRTGESTSVWNTYAIAKIQAEFCAKNGWRRVVVVAIPAHMGRAIWVYRKLGLEAVAAPMPTKGYYGRGLCDPMLCHWATFRIREIFARILFWYWRYI